MFAHFSSHEFENGTNRLKINTLRKEESQGQVKFALGIVHPDRLVCLQLEYELVHKFGRIDLGTGILTNLTSGGEVGPTDFVVPELTKQLKSEIGLARREEFVEIGKKQWASYSEEKKAETVANMIEGRKTAEYRAQVSDTSKERWSDPEYKKRLSESHKKAWAKRREEKERLKASKID